MAMFFFVVGLELKRELISTLAIYVA
jgi:Na+/H+ antiporter NhaA